jgi:hypothetical protein
MKRLLIESVAQIIIWGVIACVVGFTALIFAAAVGMTATSVSPDYNFGLVERYVCPEGGKLVYENGGASTWTDENGTHSGTTMLASCVAADGSKTEGMEFQAIFAVIGLYFVICFVPLFLPGILISWIVVHMIIGAIFKKTDNPAAA